MQDNDNNDQLWIGLREYDAFKESIEKHYATKEQLQTLETTVAKDWIVQMRWIFGLIFTGSLLVVAALKYLPPASP